MSTDQVPSSRWGHALCMISDSEAVLIGGQGDKNVLCKDAVWHLDMRLYSQHFVSLVRCKMLRISRHATGKMY